MTVGELKKMLEKYPEDMQILNGRYSDYDLISEDEWSVVKAVPRAEWVERYHKTMGEEDQKAAKEYLYLEGN